MKISILTLFPEMFQGIFDHSILRIAQEKNLVSIDFTNIRNFGIGKHKTVDDTPYGGGAGMVMRVDVIASALANSKLPTSHLTSLELRGASKIQNSQPKVDRPLAEKLKERVILLDPQGKTYNQKKAKSLAKMNHLIFLCGRYEGVDERVRGLVDEEISIGDYVLTGGEIPAMAIIDSIVRLIPGVIKKESSQTESFSILNSQFSIPTLEYPQYTKPSIFNGKKVPDILLSGDHKKILEWRETEAIKKTKKQRPDLLTK